MPTSILMRSTLFALCIGEHPNTYVPLSQLSGQFCVWKKVKESEPDDDYGAWPMVLGPEAWEKFIDEMENPSPPTEALLKGLRARRPWQ